MPKKYHIPTETTPPRFEPIGKYATVEFREDCAGSCRECVKKKCVYGIFKDNYFYEGLEQKNDLIQNLFKFFHRF